MNWPSNWRRRKRSAEETHEEEEEEDGDDRCDGVRSFSCRVDSGQNSTKWTRGWNNEPFRASKRTHRSMILVWLEELYMSAYVYIYFCFCLKWFEFKLNLIRGLQNSAKHINYFTLQQQSQVPTKVSISLSHPFRWYSYWNQTVLVIHNDPRCSYLFHFLEICIVYKTWRVSDS